MSKHKILVIQSGWVLTGAVTDAPEGWHVQEAYTIRTWGTTAGLGQLAIEGARPDTKLDYVGTAFVPKNVVLFLIDCKKALK